MSNESVEYTLLRIFVREAYKLKRKPGYAFYQYRDTFKSSPNSAYYHGAIFGDNPTEQDKATYLRFLKSKYLDDDSKTIRFYILEFQELPDKQQDIPFEEPKKSQKWSEEKWTEQECKDFWDRCSDRSSRYGVPKDSDHDPTDPRFKHSMSWYVILGVPRDASYETIKLAWRRLYKIYHPDLPTGNLEIMQTINKAWDFAKNLHNYRK